MSPEEIARALAPGTAAGDGLIVCALLTDAGIDPARTDTDVAAEFGINLTDPTHPPHRSENP